MLWFYILIFIGSCALLGWSGSFLVKALKRLAVFLGWREFVVAFFVMAFASSLPNLFVGVNSALRKIPQLSFGEIVGGNIVDLTLAVALAILIARISLKTESRMVQTSTIFTVVIAILPLILILDGILGRGDGLILLLTFAFYSFWLFSKKERFKKIYEDKNQELLKGLKGLKSFWKDLGGVILALLLLSIAAEGVVRSSVFFAKTLNVSLPLIGILIVGLSNSLPETYFAIASARKGQTWMILGDLMGAVIVPATLVLGVVALICPIKIVDFSPFAIARIFLVISAIFFLIIVRTGQKITKKEGLILVFLYILFVATQFLIR